MVRRCAWTLLVMLCGCVREGPARVAVGAPTPDAAPEPALAPSFCERQLSEPARTVLERPCGTLAGVLTVGARAVRLEGPARTFSEASETAAVVTTSWIRVLPAPFSGTVDPATATFVDRALRDTQPDLLWMAMQYLGGAPPLQDPTGLQYAGDADYGPLTDLGVREEGADFNDYLGVEWSYGSVLRRPKGELFRSLDCSGYVRMLWGYRSGVPLAPGADLGGQLLPRRAVQMAAAPIGAAIASVTDLQAGDLVFFDADPDDGPAIDHVGMFLGQDDASHLRFISSRKNANGPTLGDVHGASILDGNGLYAKAYRQARRL